ncbi:hypothetical protein OH799_21875 [Nocardia sp. NBC_00881]|uniref:hypothetical protein n=1 Tax=Nocardia sp. NBC_00881 TaxID=2975995 RepID=UPI00386E51CC|nr:hypothetical protein OH799_21875 [Nocardia sp. NBC_00881]
MSSGGSGGPVSVPAPGPSTPTRDGAGVPRPDLLDGTASTHLTRLVRDTALRAGVGADRIAAVPGVDDAALAGELNRIPLRSLVRLWELLARTRTV